MSDDTFDYIIVGGGTAGCLLANRLSADKTKRVLMIEAGGKDNYHWIHIPVGYLYCIGNPRTDWCFQTEPEPGLNGRSLRYPRGKTLGGSSSINGMIYMRGQSRDYAQWAELTQEADWGWDACLNDFKAHENYYKLDSKQSPPLLDNSSKMAEIERFHGHPAPLGNAQAPQRSTGEWRIDKQRLQWDILDAFAQAANQAGIASTDDFNQGNNEGVGYFEVNQKNGFRWNTAKAFVRPVCYGRPNFEMWTGAQVTRLILEATASGEQRCTGAEVMGTRPHTAQLALGGEMLLCAGAVGSPHILQLSGIGPTERLQQHGVAPAVHSPGVGENLQDHLQIRSVYKVQGAKTLNTLANHWWGKAKMGLEYAFARTGPLSMAPSQLGAFTRSSSAYTWPNLQYHVQPLSLEAFGEPLHSFPAFTASVCNLNPSSRGSVRIQSPLFDAPPAIAPNYLSTPEDRQVATDSLRVTRNIVSQPALAAFKPEEVKPGVQFQSDAELAQMAGDIATTIFHPVGTAKMGADDDPMAVLDAHLRVRDPSRGPHARVQGLRVVDASAMPRITSGNTNSPTLMMAEKAARWILTGQ